MIIHDSRDLAVSTADADLVAGLEKAHELFLTYSGDPIGEIEEVLDGAPDFVMGHIFKAALLTQAMETRIYGDMVNALESAEALASRANERERMHIRAIRAWADGDFHRAVDLWDDVLVHYPRDLLALQLAHLSDVLLGDTTNQRDRVARILHAWDESVPGYGYVLGLYAFGLEENRDFAMAEECGRRAVALNPADAYAVHAVAHVMESQGRQSGGINWMRSREGDWAYGNFANHLWWHLSIYHLDLGQTDRVLDVYDTCLRSTDQSGDRYEELDAAALLWRLNLLGIDVGDRWKTLADKWEPSATDTLYAFNDVHAMMTFVADGRWEVADRVLHAHERYTSAANDANSAMTRTVGEPFCRALKAFAKEEYGAAVETLLPIRYRTRYLGGSHAQREIIGLTLLEAALRDGRHELALALASERTALKPTSPQNWRFAARAHRGLGDHRRAAEAEARAVALHG
jgi:tetratricopeptide (TPR) repeat protein